MKACKYGNCSWSAKFGIRAEPMTVSISDWMRFWHSGYDKRASTNACRKEVVVSAPASISVAPRCLDHVF